MKVTAKDECTVLKYGLDEAASPNAFIGNKDIEYILGSEGFDIGVPVLFQEPPCGKSEYVVTEVTAKSEGLIKETNEYKKANYSIQMTNKTEFIGQHEIKYTFYVDSKLNDPVFEVKLKINVRVN